MNSISLPPSQLASASQLDVPEAPVLASADIGGDALGLLFDNIFSGEHPRFCPIDRAWAPPTDVYETADAIHVKMDVAGVAQGDIEVKVRDSFLVIRGRRIDDSQAQRENFHLMEIPYGRFERAFRLPLDMQVRDITAEVAGGFLHVTVPKDGPGREIRIQIV